MIPLFDLHSDTLLELYRKNEDILENSLHISLNKARKFSPYIQVLAIWSDSNLTNEDAYQNYINVRNYARGQNIYFANKATDFRQNTFILAVEDARILNGDLSRIYKLYGDGVRLLTLNWQGNTVIGGGWDTSEGLTSFGKDVVKECLQIGIIPDISHSSEKASYEALSICSEYNKPLIASHSNSFSVCKHKRNLSDDLFKIIANTKGLVGISLASEHISKDAPTLKDVLEHIYHYLSLGGENTIALGCDFDGVTSLPLGISSISDLNNLYYKIEDNFGTSVAKKIFFENAYKFMCKNLV